MGFGMGVLRLSPRDFWNITPRELAAAHDGLFGTAATPISRADFAALAACYPDEG